LNIFVTEDTEMADRQRLHELLESFSTAMLVTTTAEGGLHARPMAIAELEPDADAYFVTSIDSPKVGEILADRGVLLTFQDERRYAALYGRMLAIDDRALLDRLWKESWKVWFPRGKADPSLTLLKFEAASGEFWENAGTRGLKYAFEATKAYVTGETPKPDDDLHGRVRL
jgi:general stress protein 26